MTDDWEARRWIRLTEHIQQAQSDPVTDEQVAELVASMGMRPVVSAWHPRRWWEWFPGGRQIKLLMDRVRALEIEIHWLKIRLDENQRAKNG